MLKEDANNKVIEINSKREKMFCPIIKNLCRIDCTCYAMAEIQVIKNKTFTKTPDTPDQYEVIGGYCDCYLLTGITEVLD